MTVAVRPVGSVSTTVTRPLFGPVPTLLTVRVYWAPVCPWVKFPKCVLTMGSESLGNDQGDRRTKVNRRSSEGVLADDGPRGDRTVVLEGHGSCCEICRSDGALRRDLSLTHHVGDSDLNIVAGNDQPVDKDPAGADDQGAAMVVCPLLLELKAGS